MSIGCTLTVYCGGNCEYRVHFVGPHTVNLKLDIQYVPLLVCNCLGTYGCKLVLRVYFFLFVALLSDSLVVLMAPRGLLPGGAMNNDSTTLKNQSLSAELNTC